MKKQIEVVLPDLFNLSPSLETQILQHMQKNRRVTQTIISKKLKCSLYAARDNLNKLVAKNLARDLGFHRIGGKNYRVYEIV